MRYAFLLLMMLLSGCSTAPERIMRHELLEQILTPRKGAKGLTNRACDEWEEGKGCKTWGVRDYDLNDPAIRKQLNDLGFLCQVGGRRFKVCLDKPGFCRISWDEKRDCFLGICGSARRVNRKVEYVPVEPYQALLDAKVRCASREYPLQELD